MREHNQQVLQQIEREYDVKVLYACESGSRAWGLESEGSDYDVRFLYVHRMEWYLSIDQPRDVLEIPSSDSLTVSIDPLLDVSGWELTKALRLYRKSNPSIFEWLHSSIVYYDRYETAERLLALESKVVSPTTCLYHYVSMSKRNEAQYLYKDLVDDKKYFTGLRPLLSARWILEYKEVPPVSFAVLVDSLIQEKAIKQAIYDLIRRKKGNIVKNAEAPVAILNEYIHNEIRQLERAGIEATRKTDNPTEKLNVLFRELLNDAWK